MASFFSRGNSTFDAVPGRDVEQLFGPGPGTVQDGNPASSSLLMSSPPSAASPSPVSVGAASPPVSLPYNVNSENTLDEPVWETVKRDLMRIGRNLVMVVFPFQDRSQQTAALRNWDLWGPMAFTLALAVLLSIGAAKPSSTFSLVFALVSVGAIALTVNVVLLGGTIGFFQSLCLLGYCLFPLDAAALLCVLLGSAANIAKWVLIPIAIAWSTWASVPFIGGAVPPRRKGLAIYPLCLLYVAIGWLAVVR